MWRRNLSVAWIDYKKAFDMTPHAWIRDLLKAMRAPQIVQSALAGLIPKWQTTITLRGENELHQIPVRFRRGLYQGDSLSPLLFCLGVAPLSLALGTDGGFRSDFQRLPLRHQMFMDDLKVYEESKAELEASVAVVDEVSEAVGMELGVRKCAVAHMRAGSWGGSPPGAQERLKR